MAFPLEEWTDFLRFTWNGSEDVREFCQFLPGTSRKNQGILWAKAAGHQELQRADLNVGGGIFLSESTTFTRKGSI